MLKRISSNVAAYVAWFLSSAIALYAMLKAWEAVLKLHVALGFSRWAYAAVHNFSIVILGLAWLVGILFIENAYRVGSEKGQLPGRIIQVTLAEAIALVAIFAVHFLAS